MHLVIAHTTIRQDSAGRYCLNDLHRASGGHPKARPGEWIRNKQTRALIDELGGADIPAGPVATINDGQTNGTFVAKELVYAYGMWISPAFHLKVIRAYDAMANQPAAVDPTKLTRMQLLELAMQTEQERIALLGKVDELAPKAEALARLGASDGSLCVSDAAKTLNMRPKDLFAWLQSHQWLYRRAGASGWTGYQSRIQVGYLEHVATTVERSDGTEKLVERVKVTPKGLARLAELVSTEQPTAAADRATA